MRHYTPEALFPDFQRHQLPGSSQQTPRTHSLCALDIVLLFGRRHAPPFFDGGGAERCREERGCVDEEEVSGHDVKEEQLCVCGAACFRHWFQSFCVLCASSLFVCMFFHFLYIFFHIQIPRLLDSTIPSFIAPHILSLALTFII